MGVEPEVAVGAGGDDVGFAVAGDVGGVDAVERLPAGPDESACVVGRGVVAAVDVKVELSVGGGGDDVGFAVAGDVGCGDLGKAGPAGADEASGVVRGAVVTAVGVEEK